MNGNAHIYELAFDPKVGHDVAKPFELDFKPSDYVTKKGAAEGLREALVKWAVSHYGMTRELAENEISVWSPVRTKQYSGCSQWCVVWESGPFNWAIQMSMQISGPWGFCEPYYSFDLHFTD